MNLGKHTPHRATGGRLDIADVCNYEPAVRLEPGALLGRQLDRASLGVPSAGGEAIFLATGVFPYLAMKITAPANQSRCTVLGWYFCSRKKLQLKKLQKLQLQKLLILKKRQLKLKKHLQKKRSQLKKLLQRKKNQLKKKRKKSQKKKNQQMTTVIKKKKLRQKRRKTANKNGKKTEKKEKNRPFRTGWILVIFNPDHVADSVMFWIAENSGR